MAKTQTLTDEELLRRSGYAGSILATFAVLVTVCAGVFVFDTVQREARIEPVTAQSRSQLLSLSISALPLTLCAVAIGLWLLAVAARRGNPTAPGVVLLVLAFQVLLFLTASCTVLAHGGVPTALLGVVIVLLIAAAVSSGRNVLIEMKKRGLWEAKFAAARASRGFCACGGILLIAGYFGWNASLIIPAVLAAQNAKERAKEVEQAKAFLECLKEKEPEAMLAMQNLAKTRDSASIDAAMSNVEALDRGVASVQSDVAPDVPLYSILATYRDAIANWKDGLAALGGLEPDGKKAMECLKKGGSLRAKAASEFGRRYLSH